MKWALTWATGSEDTFAQLRSDCQQGFPLLGDLPPCDGAVLEGLPKSFPRENLEEEENQVVLNKIKDLPFSHDIMPQTVKDAEHGFMSYPRLLIQSDLTDVNLTRRIPVREERESGWRTRVVDHETESMINEATRPCDKNSTTTSGCSRS